MKILSFTHVLWNSFAGGDRKAGRCEFFVNFYTVLEEKLLEKTYFIYPNNGIYSDKYSNIDSIKGYGGIISQCIFFLR